MVTKNVKKETEKIIFIIGCMSHPEIAISSRFLGNYRILRLDYESKTV